MNRKGDEGGDLLGLMIGAVGALCVWVGVLMNGGGAGWVSDPDGVLRWFDGGRWVSGEERSIDDDHDQRVVVLVHGLDEPGGIWDDLAPALSRAGYRVVRFDYPNDQAIVRSAEGLDYWMGLLRVLGIERVDLVAHSMGGLVSREALTNPEMGASSGGIAGVRVGRLILVGTPNEGSAWAKLRGVAEVRERVQRWVSSDELDLSLLGGPGALGIDGDGRAGVDLLPGSDFLVSLNGRAMPGSVRVTCVVGRVVDPAMTFGRAELDAAADALGDGVVSVDSAVLDGCDDVVHLVANHRSMLRTMEVEEGWRAMVGSETEAVPGAIGVILDRLGSDQD